MQIAHVGRALEALTMREIIKFAQQRGRLLSALVRPLMWLVVFAAGFYNVFGVSIIPPYKTYITYQVYIVPGLLGIILLFHGMQSSLSMVYDREMGVMRLLLTAPLPRWVLLACKLVAGTALSVITCYAFLLVCIPFDVTFEPIAWITVLPALTVSGLMLGALWLFISVYIKQVENFAGAMNFVMFPMFFFSSALRPVPAAFFTSPASLTLSTPVLARTRMKKLAKLSKSSCCQTSCGWRWHWAHSRRNPRKAWATCSVPGTPADPRRCQ